MNNLSGYGVFEIAGEQIAFKYGINAYKLFSDHRGIGLEDVHKTGLYGEFIDGKITKDPDVLANAELAYFAYVTACEMKGQEIKYNLLAFTEMLSEEKEVLVKLFNLNLESKLMGRTLSEIAADESKKKNLQNGPTS